MNYKTLFRANYMMLLWQTIMMLLFVLYLAPTFIFPAFGMVFVASDFMHLFVAMFLGAVASVPLWALFFKARQ